MQSTAKALAEARDLAAALTLRLANSSSINFVRQAADAQNWPMLFLSVGGNEAEGQPVIVLRIKGLVRPNPDVFGQVQYAYAPHTLELAYELASSAKPIPSAHDLFIAMFESTKTGITILQEEIANGTAVTEASMNASNPVSELNDLYWPNKGV
jgi:hypothetical protein